MSLKLDSLNMQALVAIHNSISDKPVSMKTFSQRSKAVARIEKIAGEQGIDLSQRFDENGIAIAAKAAETLAEPHEVEMPAETAAPREVNALASLVGQMVSPAARAPEAPKPAAPRKEAKEKKEKGPVIRVVAEALLLEVVSQDADKRPYGHSYDTILSTIHTQFPEGKTSVACLRWYAVHMRERGERVPNRPRAPAKKIETKKEA